MVLAKVCAVKALLALLTIGSSDGQPHHHHHHHGHHHGHHHHHSLHNASTSAAETTSGKDDVALSARAASAEAATDSPVHTAPRRHAHSVAKSPSSENTVSMTRHSHVEAGLSGTSDDQILAKLKNVEHELDEKEQKVAVSMAKGHLNVNGPLPVDFSERFAQGVADATGCRPAEVTLLGAVPVAGAEGGIEEIFFRSRSDVVTTVEDQAANPQSTLANGILRTYLVAKDDDGVDGDEDSSADSSDDEPQPKAETAAAPEVDMAMPYGDLEPFGREDTAQELTESSIRESNAMVDQLEKAEVAEEKRAVFRALTRLRGAAITSYDGIARSQTGNIDEYARNNQWRPAHPVHHLADDEADVTKWAFPDGAGD